MARHHVICAATLIGVSGVLPGLAAAQDKTPYFTPHGTGQKLDDATEQDEVKFSSAQTEGRFTLEDEIWTPAFRTNPHFHKEHAEAFYVLEGQMEWTVGGETRVVSAGDSIYIPPNTIHSARMIGNRNVHILFMSQPGGFEHLQEMPRTPTEGVRKDPKLEKALRKVGDMYPAPGK